MVHLPHTTYYNRRGAQGSALIRARRPYLFKNMITGTTLFAITVAIYVYTIKTVGQDNFEDVVVPDKPAAGPPPAQKAGPPKQ